MVDFERGSDGLLIGFTCQLCGTPRKFTEPVADADVLVCPDCGSPICTACTEPHPPPSTAEEAQKCLESGGSGCALAMCANCGCQTLGFLRAYLEAAGFEFIKCSICGNPVLALTAHLHQDEWVGDECCWDERLKITE